MQQERTIGVVDIVFLCTTAVLSMVLLMMRAFWVPSVARMLADFGGRLPTSTMLSLTWFFPLGAVFTGAVLDALGLLLRRTALSILATAVVSAAIALTVWGMYAPIFELAGNIRAD